MNKRIWLLASTAFLAALVISIVNAASASLPAGVPSASAGTGTGSKDQQTQYSDDFDSLKPAGLKGISMSTLVNSGRVHVNNPSRPPGPPLANLFAPSLNINWGPDVLTGAGQGEPGVGMNQTNLLYALVSGNFSVDHTTNLGFTWTSLANPPNPHSYGDVVNAWLTDSPNHALEIALNPSSDGNDLTCAQSTDSGVTWANFAACSTWVDSSRYFDDREYIWVDNSPSSPFFGRVYVTETIFDPGASGSIDTMTVRHSSDNGNSWLPPGDRPIALVPNNEFALGLNHNEYPSLGISPNGTIGYVWHRGMCCGGPSPINSPNKVMFTRSTDGGVTFPFSTTIATVPLNQSVPFNATSPFGQRWSDTPNIAADPSANGVFYAVWTAYRTPGTPASAAIYLSKTTDNGATWSAPTIPFNNPNANIFQGFGWVKVTADHTVHVTYFGGTTSNSVGGQFYVQSTDGGATWSTPFQLNATAITTFAAATDYMADDVGTSLGSEGIIAGIEENDGHHARMGIFTASTPTPTVTGTPSTATPTATRTSTPTATATPCSSGAIQNGGFETGTFPPWVMLGTIPRPIVTNTDHHAGSYSALIGNVVGPEPNGNGSIYQQFIVPAGGGTLSFWWNGGTTDSIQFDWQDAYITDSNGTILATIMHTCQTTNDWVNQTYNLAPYAGQTVRVEFLVHEDGFGDNTYMLVDDVEVITACPTPISTATYPPGWTPSPRPTICPICSPPHSHTPTPTPTQVATMTPTPTPTACPIQFSDVPQSSTFYSYLRCLACRGIINGYSDGTFKPNDNVTRGQLSKIVSNSAGFDANPSEQRFQDVPSTNPFYAYIYRLAQKEYIRGYACGTPPAGACVPPTNLPYFLPNANASRGQISKIVSNAAGFSDPPGGQQFQDVSSANAFYPYIFRLSTRGFISGYACGGVGEPCVPPLSLPYFRPNANATRGQMSKIDASAFFPNCNTP